MKGSERTEPPGRNNTTGQLEEEPCRQNNKQKQAEQQTDQTEQAEQYSIEQMDSLRDMSYLIKSF